jgi:hypothetical protein
LDAEGAPDEAPSCHVFSRGTARAVTNAVPDLGRNDLLVVLLDALERYYKYAGATDEEGRHTFRETVEWFRSRERSHPRSFESVCTHLSLDPERIRTSLARRDAEVHGELAKLVPCKR